MPGSISSSSCARSALSTSKAPKDPRSGADEALGRQQQSRIDLLKFGTPAVAAFLTALLLGAPLTEPGCHQRRPGGDDDSGNRTHCVTTGVCVRADVGGRQGTGSC